MRSIQPDAFQTSPDPTLLGGYSPTSAQFHFPRQPVCPYTGADDVVPVELSTTATLWGWTTVTTAPPGYAGTVPYGFGIVELNTERLRILTRLTESDTENLTFGEPMRLVCDIVDTDAEGIAIATWAFASERDPIIDPSDSTR